MTQISPFTYAAVMIAARLFAISMYVPHAVENPTLTAVVAVLVCAAKALLMIPLFLIPQKLRLAPYAGKGVLSAAAVFFFLSACALLLCVGDAFSTVVESVYPDRFTKIGIAVTLLPVAAYVASMGFSGLARTSCAAAASAAVIFALIFVQSRANLHTEYLNFYSENISEEIRHTVKNLVAFTGDWFLFFSLLPRLKGSPKKAAGIYLFCEALACAVFFLMCGAAMGGYWCKSGFSFYSLAYCTHGSLIDRADGLFLAAASACAVVTCASLITVIKNSLRFLFPRAAKNGAAVCLWTAVIGALAEAAFIGFDFHIGEYTSVPSLITAAVIFCASAAAAIYTGLHAKKEMSEK